MRAKYLLWAPENKNRSVTANFDSTEIWSTQVTAMLAQEKVVVNKVYTESEPSDDRVKSLPEYYAKRKSIGIIH